MNTKKTSIIPYYKENDAYLWRALKYNFCIL